MAEPRVALVHDWLTNQGGGERVLWSLHQAYPKADVYTSVFDPKGIPQFAGLPVKTSFLQHWPLAIRKHQLYPMLRPIAFESFDLRNYDVVISTSSAESKGVITQPHTLHICYIFTPTRYYWSGYEQYLNDPGFGGFNPLVRLVLPRVVKSLRHWDYAAAQRPDILVADSKYVAERITKYYDRQSSVIYPPIEFDRFKMGADERSGYVTFSRLIPYKRVDLAVKACNALNLPLTVIGDGSERQKLEAMAGPSIKFVGRVGEEQVVSLLGQAKALIFPADEDFGLTPLEAMACGTPVIAYGRGGALETVIEGKTGVFFKDQDEKSIVEAIKRFEDTNFDRKVVRERAEGFDERVFISSIRQLVESQLKR